MSEKNILQEYCQKHRLSMPKYESWSFGSPHCLKWSARVTLVINSKNITMETIVETNNKTTAEKQAASLMVNYIKQKKNLCTKTNLTRVSEYIASTESGHKPSIIEIDINDDDDAKIDTKTSREIKYPLMHVNNNLSITPDSNSQLKTIFEFRPKKIYMIDLENKPVFKKTFFRDNLYIGFINSIHSSIMKYSNWHCAKSDNIQQEYYESSNNLLLYVIDGAVNDLSDHFMTCFAYSVIDYVSTIVIETDTIPEITIVSGDHSGWCTRICMEKILNWKRLSNNICVSNAIDIV